MKKILIVVGHYLTIYSLRKELVIELINQGYEVTIAVPYTEEIDFFKKIGCNIIDTPIDRRKTNPLKDIKLLFQYIKIMLDIKPNVVLTFTIKPNIYGSIAARFTKTPVLNTITGIGSVFINDIKLKNLITKMYKVALNVKYPIFFLNEDNKNFYKDLKIISKKHPTIIVPGSGVNTSELKYSELKSFDPIRFTFIGRIIKDKGIIEFLKAADIIMETYSNVEFEVIGPIDDENLGEIVNRYHKEKIINYKGYSDDIYNDIINSTCIVLPSYGEGRGTVLQEGASVGRPLITTDTYGCRENVDKGINGFLVEPRSSESLAKGFMKFLKLNKNQIIDLSINSRKKAVNEFDRKIVTDTYIKEIHRLIGGN